MLMQPLLQFTHDPDGDDHRNNVSLITDRLHIEEQQMPYRYFAGLHSGHSPGVDQTRMNHTEPDDTAQENIPAEYPGRTDGDDHRQIGEGRTGNQIQELIPVRAVECRICLPQRLYQTHHQTGCHDGRKNRNEYISQCLHQPFRQRLPGRCGRLHICFRGRRHAGDRQKLIINLVDCPRSDDQLQLSIGIEHALHALHIFQRLGVHLAVVRNDQPETRCAVGGADDVVPSAQVAEDLLSALPVVQCHKIIPPFHLSVQAPRQIPRRRIT